MRAFCRLLLCLFVGVFALSAITIAETDYSYIRLHDYGFPLQQLFSVIGHSGIRYTENEEAIFDETVLETLKSYQEAEGLEPSGMFDFETLCCVLHVVYDSLGDEIVWIPLHGGKKYHRNSDCSSMYEPRQVPVVCAEGLGFTFCKRCYK